MSSGGGTAEKTSRLRFELDDAAVNRAHLDALRRIVGADALGALHGVNHVNRIALADRLVRALGLARAAADAVVLDHHRHRVHSSLVLGAGIGRYTSRCKSRSRFRP